MRIVRGLGNEHTAAAFDEVVGSNICHDLGTGQDLSMELLFNLVELLYLVSMRREVQGNVLRTASS